MDKTYIRMRSELNDGLDVDYEKVNEVKMALLSKQFLKCGAADMATDEYADFEKNNAFWLPAYADFCAKRDAKWKAVSRGARCREFYCWLQFHLDRQLHSVVDYAHSKGVAFKGDLPIGVSPDSVDVIQYPSLFNTDCSAGAPPDFFSADGQNWGFPTYNWEEMSKDGYLWWKNRLKKMSEYFDVFRIDHILGFFRIWEIPLEATSGMLGHFNPALPLTPDEMEKLYGFRFKEAFLEAVYCPTDVLFLKDEKHPGMYSPRISAQQTSHYDALPQDQKDAFNRLHEDFFYHRHDEFWKKGALTKLKPLLGCTNMVACGEDLGMIPACVPEVMKKLNILSLEIQAMPKAYGTEFGDPKQNPRMSVCTTSTHDMPPLRLWWELNRGDKDARFFYNYLHWEGDVPFYAEDWLIRGIFEDHFKSPSIYKIFPIQDYMAISAEIRRIMPAEEQINNPADPNHYWRYRMHISLERLLEEENLATYIRELILKNNSFAD